MKPFFIHRILKNGAMFLLLLGIGFALIENGYANSNLPPQATDPNGDADGDGLTDQEEANYGTIPNPPAGYDTDHDGIADGPDGWALCTTLNPARVTDLPAYAAINLTDLTHPIQVNNVGDVLGMDSNKNLQLWSKGQLFPTSVHLLGGSQGLYEQNIVICFLNDSGEFVGLPATADPNIQLQVWNKTNQTTRNLTYRGNLPASGDLDDESIFVGWCGIDNTGTVYASVSGSGNKEVDGPHGPIQEDAYWFKAGVKWVGNQPEVIGELAYYTYHATTTYALGPPFPDGIPHWIGTRTEQLSESYDGEFDPYCVTRAGIVLGFSGSPHFGFSIYHAGLFTDIPSNILIEAISDGSEPWLIGNKSADGTNYPSQNRALDKFTIWKLNSNLTLEEKFVDGNDGSPPDPRKSLAGNTTSVNERLELLGSFEGYNFKTRLRDSGLLIRNGKIDRFVTSHDSGWLPTSDTPTAAGLALNDFGCFVGKQDNSYLLLVPVNITVKKQGDNSPIQGGLIVKKGETLEISLSDIPQDKFPIPADDIVWQFRQIKAIGSFTPWGFLGTKKTGVKTTFTAETSGIFQVKAVLYIGGVASGNTQEVQFLRKRDAANATDSQGRLSETCKKGQPDYFGVVDTEIQRTIRQQAYINLGSTNYAEDASLVVRHDPVTGDVIIPAGANKCNAFVYHKAGDAGATVPLTRPDGPYQTSPPLAFDWYDDSYSIPGWQALGTDAMPQPGFVVARPDSRTLPGGSNQQDRWGHVGILDYDGSWLQAGAKTVNKYPHLTDGDYQPVTLRKYTGN